MYRTALAVASTVIFGVASVSACEVSDMIGGETCPIKLAMTKYDTNEDKVIDSAELAAVAADESLEGTPAAKGMTPKIAKIIVRMLDADKDKLITAEELQNYVDAQKKG